MNKKLITAVVLSTALICWVSFVGCSNHRNGQETPPQEITKGETNTVPEESNVATKESTATENVTVTEEVTKVDDKRAYGYEFMKKQLETQESIAIGPSGTDYYSINLFFNQPSELNNIDNLAVAELEDILLKHGIDPNAETKRMEDKYISMYAFSNYRYTLDLSVVKPLYHTTDGEIVCVFRSDPEEKLLFVLEPPEAPNDGQRSEPECSFNTATPMRVRYYLDPSWDLAKEASVFFINGKLASTEEMDLCIELLSAHIQEPKNNNWIIDGTSVETTITVLFQEYPGLEYHFDVWYYQESENEPGLYVLNRLENTQVFVPVDLVCFTDGPFARPEPTEQPVESEPVLDYKIGSSFSELSLYSCKNSIDIVNDGNVILFRDNNFYVIAGAFDGGDKISGYAIFTKQHEMHELMGTVPMIEIDDPAELLGLSYREVTAKYGTNHVGLHMDSTNPYPGYITSSGYIMLLSLDSSDLYRATIREITMMDYSGNARSIR